MIAADHGVAKADARKLVDAVFSTITEAVAKREEISLTGALPRTGAPTLLIWGARDKLLRRVRRERSPTI